MKKNYITLSNGNKLPKIGFGTYKLEDEKSVFDMLNMALQTGYEMIDTAYFYKNEHFIGNALKNIGAKRENYMMATKVWPSDFGYDNTLKSIDRSLKNLQMDYIDIMYLHWPGEDMEESYKAIERFYEEGVIKNIAVANFYKKHYEVLEKSANIKPHIVQLEIHPINTEKDLVDFYEKNDIQVVSWSPLARIDKEIPENKILNDLSKKYNKTFVQIVLAWHLKRGLVPIPKTKTPSRAVENFDIFDIDLEDEEVEMINSINRDFHITDNANDENWLYKIRRGL